MRRQTRGQHHGDRADATRLEPRPGAGARGLVGRAEIAAQETSLILASVEVANVHGLYEEYKAKGAPFAQTLTRQSWGGADFQVRDPDGNVISFVTCRG